MILSPEQIQAILSAHCYRVISDMEHSELFSYAIDKMKESFDTNPGMGDTNLNLLLGDMLRTEGNDEDSLSEFLTGCGISDVDVDNLVSHYCSEDKLP